MKKIGKYLLVYFIGLALVLTTIIGYGNAQEDVKKELPVQSQKAK